MDRFALLLAAFLGTTGLAHAQGMDADIAAFINAPGFDAIDTVPLEVELAQQWLDTDSITPGGLVGPLEKAMLIADQAIDATRTRTAIAYGEIVDEEDGAPLPYSFVEVRHYNLGQVIRAEAIGAFGEDDVADPQAFGLGEHRAWRFVFRPMMGNTAMLLDASMRIISDEEAAGDDCSGRPCLDPSAGFDDLADWAEIQGKIPTWPPLYPTQTGEISAPAFAISRLAVLGFWANAENGYYQWTGGEHPEAAQGVEPYRFIAIDRDLGQESAIDTVWRETALNDDELFAISFRQIDVAGQIALMRARETR
ncbi:hypothetical protein [Devosia chinhatensis]|uniref:Uncharacterized protein n=1 Tax=Devosia chinhatensis TaxID=429727 RepID=A0A0F5FMR4_9HYPH|nr:hypothetical protein [Devosia chinhatensis]KKB10126.1 hypothetical protein VE26_10175 [Devosia chinhatensis]